MSGIGGDDVFQVLGRLSAASAADKRTDLVQEFVHQIRLKDGSRLIDVVPPAKLYSRSSETRTEAVSAPSTATATSITPSSDT